MPIFNRKPQHEFICMFSSNRHMREETDESLYFDTQEKKFFIVEQTEYESGPNVSVSHTLQDISEDKARSIVSRDEKWQASASRFFSGGN